MIYAKYDGDDLEEGRRFVWEHRRDGVQCPGCDIRLKVWPESITKTMVIQLATLCRLYFQGKKEWHHTREFTGGIAPSTGGRFAYFRFWDFVEAGEEQGMWKPKARGHRWLLNKFSIPQHALVFKGECLGLEGPDWSVHDAFKENFNLQKMKDYQIQSDV